MLTGVTIRNFKLFDEVKIELAERVVFVGPNNSGKTSALQALALWNAGVRRWVEKRGAGNVPKERSGVTINRRDLIAVPIPTANLLWRDLHVREGYRDGEKNKTRNVLIQIDVEGVDDGRSWTTSLEFDYANEESFYCRSRLGKDGNRLQVPAAAAAVKLAYLPPMSGLASNETRLDEGAIGVRIGEGRTAEVLRNLCWQVLERNESHWRSIVERMKSLFGIALEDPRYVKERGEIEMAFRTRAGVRLDLSAGGRGQQQTLLLLAHMAANPGTVLLLDEPDAHLEFLRQRQIYELLTETASETASQVIAASHSEIILNEAADRDTVIAFVGKPHRIDDRASQVAKALKEIGFDQYLQAEETGWVLYLEGSTDLAILRAFAQRLDHPAMSALERVFVHYVANQPPKARDHFYGVREAKQNLRGIAIYDRLDATLPEDPNLIQAMWRRREVENYLCQKSTLLAWAEAKGAEQHGDLFAKTWRSAMERAIEAIEKALSELGKSDPWNPDTKVSDDFLDPLFKRFYQEVKLPNLMRKTDYHTLAPYVEPDELDAEVKEKLDAIVKVARPKASRRSGE
ncbi:MAG TPA: AAA family ATPase [Thermoanaerobaculia bacterium]|nr:AAA family ATPase [Thermoanaerobaculia bacterium]